MSTSTTLVNQVEFDEAIASVRNNATDDVYVIVGHIDNDPANVGVLKVGQNVEELEDHVDSTQVMYIIARYESTYDMSTTVKFVYFRWLGEDVPFTMKGKFGVVHGSIQERFSPYHLFIETGSAEDFQPDAILQKLEENTGKKSKVLDSIDGHQMRGFTSTQLPERKRVAKTGPLMSSVGANVEISEDVLKAIDTVRHDETPNRWLVAEYQDSNPKGPINLTASGDGDSTELADILTEDKPMYALYRTTDIVDDLSIVKFVYIIWVGNSVKPMTKAKISTHKGIVESAFGPFHVAIFASDLADVSEKAITEKVATASGSKSHVK